jgi:hypothetical protein
LNREIGLDLAWRCSTYSRSRICFCPQNATRQGTDHDPDCRQKFMLYSAPANSPWAKKRSLAAIDKSMFQMLPPSTPSPPAPCYFFPR